MGRAQREFDRLRRRGGRHGPRHVQVFEAEQALATAKLTEKAARAEYEVHMLGPRDEAIHEAEAKVQAAAKLVEIDREFGMKLYLPCLHVGFDNLFRATTIAERAGEVLGRIKVYHAITPATRNTAHYFFALGRTFKRDDAAFGQAMLDNISKVVEEDLVATREIESMINGLGGAPDEVLLKADATCVRGRRLFEGLIRKELARAPVASVKAAAALG